MKLEQERFFYEQMKLLLFSSCVSGQNILLLHTGSHISLMRFNISKYNMLSCDLWKTLFHGRLIVNSRYCIYTPTPPIFTPFHSDRKKVLLKIPYTLDLSEHELQEVLVAEFQWKEVLD